MDKENKKDKEGKAEKVERNVLGKIYYHEYANEITGDIKRVECTKKQYEALGLAGGFDLIPQIEGFVWLRASGGALKVDTEDGTLGEDDFAVVDGERVEGKKEKPDMQEVEKIKTERQKERQKKTDADIAIAIERSKQKKDK